MGFRLGALEFLEANRSKEMGSQVVSIQRYIRGWFIRKDYKQADTQRRKAIARIQKWYAMVNKQIADAERGQKASAEKQKREERERKMREKAEAKAAKALEARLAREKAEREARNAKEQAEEEDRERRERENEKRKRKKNWKLLKNSRRENRRNSRNTRRKSNQKRRISMIKIRCGMLRSTVWRRNARKLKRNVTISWTKSRRKRPSLLRSPNYPIKTRKSSRIAQKSPVTSVRRTKRHVRRRLSTGKTMTPCKRTTSDCLKQMRMLAHHSKP